MPWYQEPMKGAARRRNARASGLARRARDTRMGKPGPAIKAGSRSRLCLNEGTGGTETSQYLEEEKAEAMP